MNARAALRRARLVASDSLSRSTPMSRPPAQASPLLPVLSFTALASFATGSATLGIFFLTKNAFAFGALENYALGLLVGVTYTFGALGAARVRGVLARALGLSARATVAVLTLVMGGLMLVPLVVKAPWALVAVLGVYAPLTGTLWPLVESYVSGGRRAGELRSAIGRFNIVWSVTLLPSFWVQARSPELVFASIAAMHFAAALFLPRFLREAGEHPHDEPHAVPPHYPELLRAHRVLHACSYLAMYALSPTLPLLLERFVAHDQASLVASTWLLARVLTFALLERWHGWHGRWAVAWIGIGLVLGGFGVTVLSPVLFPVLPALVVGLLAFGSGLAALYTAALYYAFEVGGSDGGSSHEALIGLGYSLGPLCGLATCGLERTGALAAAQREWVLLLLIAAICGCGALWAWSQRRARGQAGGRELPSHVRREV
jgi:hypothetical protein